MWHARFGLFVQAVEDVFRLPQGCGYGCAVDGLQHCEIAGMRDTIEERVAPWYGPNKVCAWARGWRSPEARCHSRSMNGRPRSVRFPGTATGNDVDHFPLPFATGGRTIPPVSDSLSVQAAMSSVPTTFSDGESPTEHEPFPRPHHGVPSLLLEVGLLNRRVHAFVGDDVGHRMVATAILDMIHLDLGVARLVANGHLPPDQPVPAPILTAWHAQGLDDASARDRTPFFIGPVDCFDAFLRAVQALRGDVQDGGRVERDLGKCRDFTFARLVDDWRRRLEPVVAIDEEDAVNLA